MDGQIIFSPIWLRKRDTSLKPAVCRPREQAAHDIEASTRALTFDRISAPEQNWRKNDYPAK